MKIDINKVKIHVFVPEEKVSELRDAVCNVGAGIIGNYTYCTFNTKGSGTFRPNEEANPYIGEKNKIEYVEEEKLEFVCDVNDVKYVISKLKEVHPYEEIGLEIIPLLDEESFE